MSYGHNFRDVIALWAIEQSHIGQVPTAEFSFSEVWYFRPIFF